MEILPEIVRLAASDKLELDTVFTFSFHGEKLCATPLSGPWDLQS
jgi:hypothetical protein